MSQNLTVMAPVPPGHSRRKLTWAEYWLVWTYCDRPDCKTCPHGPTWYGEGRRHGIRWRECFGGERPPGVSEEQEAETLSQVGLLPAAVADCV